MCLGIMPKSMGSGIKYVMVLQLSCCVTWGKILNFSEYVSLPVNNSHSDIVANMYHVFIMCQALF